MTKRFCDYCGNEIHGRNYVDKAQGQTRRVSADIEVDGVFRSRGDLKLVIQTEQDTDMCLPCVNTILAAGVRP